MQKTVTLLCPDCGDRQMFKVGADKSMATLNDVMAIMPESKERDRILEWMVKTSNTQYDNRVAQIFDNFAEPMCNINYDALGAKIKLFDAAAEEEAAIKRFKASEAAERVNLSKMKWGELMKRDGVAAFYGIFYCRKCKKFYNKLYLRIHAVSTGKEFLYVYPHRCDVCKNDLELVDENNIGLLYDGLPTAIPCGKCKKQKYIVDSVNFAQVRTQTMQTV